VRLPPSLHPTFGPTLSVAVGPSGTVDDVAEVVEEHTGVAVDLLTLSADGEGELSGSTTLGELGVLSNGGALDLTLASTPAAPAEVVKVMLPPSLQPSHGPSIAIALPLTSTVDELKTAIESITGMTRAEQELALGGFALLSGAQSLEGAGLRSGDTVLLCSARSMSCPHFGSSSSPPSPPPLLPLDALSEGFSRSIDDFPVWLTLTCVLSSCCCCCCFYLLLAFCRRRNRRKQTWDNVVTRPSMWSRASSIIFGTLTTSDLGLTITSSFSGSCGSVDDLYPSAISEQSSASLAEIDVAIDHGQRTGSLQRLSAKLSSPAAAPPRSKLALRRARDLRI